MLLSITYSVGIAQAYLLSYFLFQSRHKLWQGNIYLALLLFCIGTILSLFLTRIYHGNEIPAVIFWPIVTLPALFGPLIYLYIDSFRATASNISANKKYHAIPFIGLLIMFSPELFTPISDGIRHIDNDSIRVKIFIASYVKSLSIICYLTFCLRQISQSTLAKNIPAKALNILRLLLSLFLLTAIAGTVLGTLYWTGIYVSLWADFLELGFLTVLSYILSVFVLFTHLTPIHPKTRYATTNLDNDTRTAIAQQLTALMEQEQLFTEENYSANYLSECLGITEQNLSEVLALAFDTNFYDYSNQYRVNYFRQLVIDNPDKSLIELAFEAGFSSKSSFNRIMKSLTGLTPSQLKKQLISGEIAE